MKLRNYIVLIFALLAISCTDHIDNEKEEGVICFSLSKQIGGVFEETKGLKAATPMTESDLVGIQIYEDADGEGTASDYVPVQFGIFKGNDIPDVIMFDAKQGRLYKIVATCLLNYSNYLVEGDHSFGAPLNIVGKDDFNMADDINKFHSVGTLPNICKGVIDIKAGSDEAWLTDYLHPGQFNSGTLYYAGAPRFHAEVKGISMGDPKVNLNLKNSRFSIRFDMVGISDLSYIYLIIEKTQEIKSKQRDITKADFEDTSSEALAKRTMTSTIYDYDNFGSTVTIPLHLGAVNGSGEFINDIFYIDVVPAKSYVITIRKGSDVGITVELTTFPTDPADGGSVDI